MRGQAMKKLIVTALAIGFATALQPAAHAQFGSGIVYDPTQSVHAITQIENEGRSISNQVQQIEQGTARESSRERVGIAAWRRCRLVAPFAGLHLVPAQMWHWASDRQPSLLILG